LLVASSIGSVFLFSQSFGSYWDTRVRGRTGHQELKSVTYLSGHALAAWYTWENVFPCSLGLSATSQQYFSLTTNQPPATNKQYFSLRTNQHQPSAISHQPNEQAAD
jgi:hypothetical protein